MSAATDDPFTAPVAVPEPKKAKGDNGKGRNAAYSEAVASLRLLHPEDWEDQYRKALESRGLKYVVRLTAEERAEKEAADRKAKAQARIDALKAEFDLE